jgi:hypothetical protein
MQSEPPFVTVVDVVKVDQKERSTVHSSNFGGGGLVYKGSGFTIPVNIHTTHESWLEVWVRFSDGMEDRLTFNSNMLVREGHTLAMLMCRDQIWAIKNFTTGVTTTLIDAERMVGPNKPPFSWKRLGKLLLLIVICPAILFTGLIVGCLANEFFGKPGQEDHWMNVTTAVSIVTMVVFGFLWTDKIKSGVDRKWAAEVAKQRKFISESLAMLDDPELDPPATRPASEKPERRKRQANIGND